VPLCDLSLYSSNRYTQHTKHLEAFKSRKFSFMFFWDFFFAFLPYFAAQVCFDSWLLCYYLDFLFIITANSAYGCIYWGEMWQTKIFWSNYRSWEMMQLLLLSPIFDAGIVLTPYNKIKYNSNALNFQ
jgi:hypothetical protein